MVTTNRIQPGMFVTVKSENEILRTLDGDGCVEGMPYMAEMRKYCGQRFEVVSRPEKIIVEDIGWRAIKNTIMLRDVRCDGSYHNGCRRRCLIFFNDAWVNADLNSQEMAQTNMENQVDTGSQYGCCINNEICQGQCAVLTRATSAVPFLQRPLRSFLRPIRPLRNYIKWTWKKVTKSMLKRWAPTNLSSGSSGPSHPNYINLGDLIEVKDKKEILETLDYKGSCRGLIFSPEMYDCSGKEFRVLDKLGEYISEPSGKLVNMSRTLLLEENICGICERQCYWLWREEWVKRRSD